MDARGHLRAKRLHLFLPYVWFADSEVTVKKKKRKEKKRKAQARRPLKPVDQRENLCLMSIQHGLIKVKFACRLSKRTGPMAPVCS